MAVTSIWRVHGRIGKVLDYVENAEKTTAVSSGDGDLSDVIDYAIQQRKTSQTQVRDGEEVVQRFVSGINCHPNIRKNGDAENQEILRERGWCHCLPRLPVFCSWRAHPEIALK